MFLMNRTFSTTGPLLITEFFNLGRNVDAGLLPDYIKRRLPGDPVSALDSRDSRLRKAGLFSEIFFCHIQRPAVSPYSSGNRMISCAALKISLMIAFSAAKHLVDVIRIKKLVAIAVLAYFLCF